MSFHFLFVGKPWRNAGVFCLVPAPRSISTYHKYLEYYYPSHKRDKWSTKIREIREIRGAKNKEPEIRAIRVIRGAIVRQCWQVLIS